MPLKLREGGSSPRPQESVGMVAATCHVHTLED